MAQAPGYYQPLEPYFSLPLGTSEVTLLGADRCFFAPFANGGLFGSSPFFIRKVYRCRGEDPCWRTIRHRETGFSIPAIALFNYRYCFKDVLAEERYCAPAPAGSIFGNPFPQLAKSGTFFSGKTNKNLRTWSGLYAAAGHRYLYRRRLRKKPASILLEEGWGCPPLWGPGFHGRKALAGEVPALSIFEISRQGNSSSLPLLSGPGNRLMRATGPLSAPKPAPRDEFFLSAGTESPAERVVQTSAKTFLSGGPGLPFSPKIYFLKAGNGLPFLGFPASSDPSLARGHARR